MATCSATSTARRSRTSSASSTWSPLASPGGKARVMSSSDGGRPTRLSVPAELRECAQAEKIRAPDGVSFEGGQGAACGVIGANGSGKSTLLKLVAGTAKPTSSTLEVTGRVSALLEIGAGFHPDFSGRENAYLN